MAQGPRHDWQRPTATNAAVLFRCLRNTLRLAEGPAEVLSVLRLFCRSMVWRITGSSSTDRDEILRLHGVTHVLGLGTGEVLTPQELYWEKGYERLPDFVPRPAWIVFDVGANSGVYAVQQALRGALVYAFEPNPDCYRRLTKSLHANSVEDKVMAFNCALGAEAGSAELLVPDGLTTMGSLRPEWRLTTDATGRRVEVETVDRVCKTLGVGRIDLLKVDVEGLECDVLDGACEAFARVDRAIVEYHSRRLGRRAVELLAAHGLTTVLDEKMYHGDENMNPGVGRGLLFAMRLSDSSRSGRISAA